MAEVTIHSAALDGMAGDWTRHLFIDAEAQGDAWALVLRGDDKHKTGGSKPAALRWNDNTGQPIPFTLAHVSGEGAQRRADELAQALIGFYGSEGVSYSQRVARLDPEAMSLALMMATIGSARPHASSASHWRVGRISDAVAAKRLAREKADRSSAAAAVLASVSDPARRDELAASLQTDEEIAALEAIVLARKAQILQAQGK